MAQIFLKNHLYRQKTKFSYKNKKKMISPKTNDLRLVKVGSFFDFHPRLDDFDPPEIMPLGELSIHTPTGEGKKLRKFSIDGAILKSDQVGMRYGQPVYRWRYNII